MSAERLDLPPLPPKWSAQLTEDPKPKANPRGTSNGNCSGNADDRRRRKVWLVNEFRADVDMPDFYPTGKVFTGCERGMGVPACRCYRCGCLLTVDTVFVDRRVPGAVKTARYPKGGTYARENIRPNCSSCSAITGNELRRAMEAERQARKGKRS